jgi:hypothetical protein
MKFRTVLATAVGVGIGYVLGARAGRGKFEELKAQAQRIATDPGVRQKVADLPHQVRENLPKAQSVVSDAIRTASDKVQAKATDVGSEADQSGNQSTGAAGSEAPTDSTRAGTSTASSGDQGGPGDQGAVPDHVAESVVTEPVLAEPTVVVVEPAVRPDDSKP